MAAILTTQFPDKSTGNICLSSHRSAGRAQQQWGLHLYSLSLAENELIPIVLTYDAWGSSWQGQQVICQWQ